MPTLVSKSITCFIRLFAGASYDLNCYSVWSPRCCSHLLRKSSELQQEDYLLKTILPSWLFRALWNWLPPRHKISSIVPVIHNVPQLITGWAHGATVLRNWKKISLWNPHLNVRYLLQILNFTTDMTSKWVTYWLRSNIKLSLALASDSRLPTSIYITLTISSKSHFDATRKHTTIGCGSLQVKRSV